MIRRGRKAKRHLDKRELIHSLVTVRNATKTYRASLVRQLKAGTRGRVASADLALQIAQCSSEIEWATMVITLLRNGFWDEETVAGHRKQAVDIGKEAP